MSAPQSPTNSVKFQKIHSDLVIETQNKNFVSAEEKAKINGSLQASNNLSDLTDIPQALDNLGLTDIISEVNSLRMENERLLITNGKIDFTYTPMNGKLILDMAYIITDSNLIISEEYRGIDIVGKIGTFNDFDPEYEGNYCLVSYLTRDA